MIKKTIICDRCGAEITEDHPTKMQIQDYDYSPSCSYGKKAKGYTTTRSIHLCKKCNNDFEHFIAGIAGGEK